MIKYFIFFLLVLFETSIFANTDLVALRIEINIAAEDEKVAVTFYERMSQVNETSIPILLGFKAISILIMGKHSFNPYIKLKYFYQGKSILDKAIEKESSLELHFLRFAVQTNIPPFLPYTGDIEGDKKIIFSNLYKSTDQDLVKRIIKYMGSTEYCSENELKQLGL